MSTAAVSQGRFAAFVRRSPIGAGILGFSIALMLVPGPAAHAATATINLNDGDCSGRPGVSDPCNVTDPTFASLTYVIDEVDNAKASADVTSGRLRAYTESIDRDTDVPDAQISFGISSETRTLQSPGGNLPNLGLFDRVELQGFANQGNNGQYSVEAIGVPNFSYVLRRGIGTSDAAFETGVEIVATRVESGPLASGRVEQLVLNYDDVNPYVIGAGNIGIAFEVDYLRFNIPAAGIPYEAENEARIVFSARLDKPGGSTNFVGSIGHFVEIDELGAEEFLSPGAAINMQFVETERSTDRFSGRLESTVPITLDPGDTLTIVNAFFRVGSSADLNVDPEPAPVPVSVSNGFTTAQLYGDFPPGLVSETAVPIDWPTEPPGDEETLEIAVDIKPGETPNCFNINGHGVVPVALLGSAEFDAAQIDAATLDFNGLAVRVRGNSNPACSLEDSNDDGFTDLVCHFEDDSSAWTDGESEALITGSLFDTTAFQGVDSICLVPAN